MKAKYETAEMSIIRFESDDIITSSIDLGPYDTPLQKP